MPASEPLASPAADPAPAIRLEGLSLALGRFRLEDLSLDVRSGEYLVLLGPTGAGKTVLLETVLGLRRPARGRVLLRGRDVTGLPPERRNLGYVPQDYALFPHLTVSGNLAYGPAVRGWEPADRDARVAELLELLRLEPQAQALPATLSGGEQQRAAVGRALAVRPDVLLLDEPLCALDETRRSVLARELRRIQRSQGATFVHVCHDLDEAAEVADRVALLAEGRVHQTGTLDELVRQPRDEFVARFTGACNVFRVHGAAEGLAVLEGGLQVPAADAREGAVLVVRPEALRLLDDGAAAGETAFPGTVVYRVDRVGWTDLDVELGGAGALPWRVRLPRGAMAEPPAPGDRVRVGLAPGSVRVVPSGA